MMKAIIQKRYGGPKTLELCDVKKPVLNEQSLLVEVEIANIASGDMRVNTLDVPFGVKTIMRLVFGWKGPRRQIRGITGSGTVVETGKGVTSYKKGDRVYFINSMKAGAFAEYIVLEEKAVLSSIPDNCSFEQAAPLAFGAMTAYHFINKESIKENDEVLILGGSGSVGTYAIQLAVYYGARVTALSSLKNHSLLQSIGALHQIDYQSRDVTNLSKKYDLIFDAVGLYKKSKMKTILKEKGSYFSVKSPTKEKVKRLEELNEIVKKGKLKTIIDHVYPLEDYRKAHYHVYGKHKVGNVLLRIKSN